MLPATFPLVVTSAELGTWPILLTFSVLRGA